MYPKLYNQSGQLQAVLDNIIDETATIRRVINGEFTFSFDAHEKELKSEYFNPDYVVKIEDQTFDMCYIEQKHEDEQIIYSIQCEHVNYRMEDGPENLFPSYTYIGTPAQILTDLLSGTEFSAGVVDFTDVITITTDQEITRKSLIYQLANLLNGEVDYTNQGFTINILNTIGQNRGFEARFGKNLKGVTKIIDNRGGLKTYYNINLVELKNSSEYIEKGLQDLEVFDVGDTIKIIDEVIALNVENRIVAIQRNPIFAVNTSVEIANKIELISDKIQQIETEAVGSVKLNHPYNLTTISHEYGFRSTRSDKKARGTLGGGTLELEKGDGTGNYEKSLYYDSSTGKYNFIGDVEISGGTLNINDNFLVDSLGNVIIGSASGIANFIDAGALASKDSVNLATSDVINKIADNIQETINRKWAAESGADVTAHNISAGFQGQGDLSLLDSITSTYISDGAIITPKIATGAVVASKISVNSLSAITANIGTITTGSLTGVNISADNFEADNYVYINAANYDEGLYLRAFTDMYVRVYDPSGTLEIGPNVRVPEFLEVAGRQVITRAGFGLDKNDNTLDIDDDVVVTSTSGQNIRLQVYNGGLEFSLNGGPFIAL